MIVLVQFDRQSFFGRTDTERAAVKKAVFGGRNDMGLLLKSRISIERLTQ